MIELLTISAVAIFIYMTLFFLLAIILKDNSIVDIGWGPGFILVSIVMIIYGHPFSGMRGIAYFLVLLWGLRLAVYVFFRNRGRGEDFRYAAWRKEWGSWFVLRSYLQIFMLQGLIMLIVYTRMGVALSAAVIKSICALENELVSTDFPGTVPTLAQPMAKRERIIASRIFFIFNLFNCSFQQIG